MSRLLWLVLLAHLALLPAHAQNILFAFYKDRAHPVVSVRGTHPYVMDDGKLVAARTDRLALEEHGEFLPVFISVRNMKVSVSHLELVNDIKSLNFEFHLKADFESAYALDNVFMALDLDFKEKGKTLFLYEVGRLEPNRVHSVQLSFPISNELGTGNYYLHLFSGGRETFNSLQPFPYREAKLDQMIAKRVETAADGAPKLLIGPTPEYPKKLLKAKTKGQATLRMKIRSTGAVIDAVVVNSTDPAFGESALEAVRQWRFLPRIEKGHAVDSIALFPVNFVPPEVPAKS